MTIRLNGSTSGYVEIDAPAVGGNTSIVFPNSSGTLAKTNGNTWTGTQNFTGSTFTGGGMDLITTQTVAAVSTVSINNCFTSNYENYRINIYGKSTTNIALFARLRSSGTDASSGNYTYLEQYVNTVTNPTRSYVANQTYGVLGVFGANYSISTVEISGPNVAQYTAWTSMAMRDDALVNTGIQHTLSTSYDGITIYPNTSTFTGTIRVYGYRNS
jgi:hypothetical protein